jgi:ubiquitin fusion degradation protein 1
MEQFSANFRAMPVAFIDKPQAEFGDKVFLPPSALQRLGACSERRQVLVLVHSRHLFLLFAHTHVASLNIEYPMLFKVEDVNGRSTHCGVLEFLAEEGVVYMPHWVSGGEE